MAEKGRIVFLNGVTSAGKTSTARALQERGDMFFTPFQTACFILW
ncbi:MAG: phosphotransferase-like protein [Christensenellales bacterium]